MAPQENAGPQDPAMAQCLAVIRALVISMNRFLTLRDIELEYKAMEEEDIPYRKFGFSTLEDFLRKSNQFNISRQANGQVSISAKLSEADQHLAKLISETRSKKPSKIAKRRLPMVNFQTRYQFNRPSPAQPRPNYRPQQITYGFNNNNYRRNSNPQQSRIQCGPNGMWLRAPMDMPRAPPPMYRQNNAPMQMPTFAPAPPVSNWTPLPPEAMIRHTIMAQASREVFFAQREEKMQQRPAENRSWPSNNITIKCNNTTPLPQPRPQPPATQNVCGPPRNPQGPPQRPLEPHTERGNRRPTNERVRARHPRVKAPSPLFVLPQSLLSKIQTTPKKPIGDRLNVRPASIAGQATKSESQDSGVSTEKRLSTNKKKQYPVILQNSEVVERLHELLLRYPGGVLESHLPKVFEEATKMSLPANWTSVVTAYSPQLFSIDFGSVATVVYANELQEDEEEEETTEVVDESQLLLPWNEPHWNVFVTHVVASTMIWARLIGAEHSERWDELMATIETKMSEPAHPKTVEGKPEVGTVYLLNNDIGWFRVRCQEVDAEGRQMLGFYVDQGNEEWLDVNTVFVCDKEFLSVPEQAVLFSLFGMDAMEGNPYAKPILERQLMERAFVAELVTREEEYEEETKIKVVLYDTSGADDVNLVEQLHERICEAGRPPQLNAVAPTQVKVTYVSDRGDVICQVPNTGFEYVQRLVQTVVQKEDSMIHCRGLKENLASGDAATRYLVFDRENDSWYRAVLKVRHPQTARHQMYCLDFGHQVQVAEADIYHLEPLCKALSRFPAMALRLELYDIPKMNARIISRIRDLLELQSMGMVKVLFGAGLDGIPRVNFYKRFDSNHLIVCINDTLRLEHDLELSFAK